MRAFRLFENYGPILCAMLDLDRKTIRVISAKLYTSLSLATPPTPRRKPKRSGDCWEQSTFLEALKGDEPVSAAAIDRNASYLFVGTRENGALFWFPSFPRAREPVALIEATDYRSIHARHKWTAEDIWIHQEMMLVVQRDQAQEVRFTLFSQRKIATQLVVPRSKCWALTRSGSIWSATAEGRVSCSDGREFAASCQSIDHLFPTSLRGGEEALLIIAGSQAKLVSASEFAEVDVQSLSIPGFVLHQVFCRKHAIDTSLVVASYRDAQNEYALVRICISGDRIEVLRFATFPSRISAVFTSNIVIVVVR